MRKFKKIYIEITNMCNLSCSFCSKSKRQNKEMTVEEFEHIIKKIDKHTNYIYLHVKGEPLLHSKLEDILNICSKYNKKVHITTNGTLISKRLNLLLSNNCITQLNISLHSENKEKNYLDNIFNSAEKLSKNKAIIYRFWTMNNNSFDEKSTSIVEKIIDHYDLSTEIVEKIQKDIKTEIQKNIHINKANQFIWPSLDNNYMEEEGYCHALRIHIAILVDGTVVPCCLDGEGVINLGNIFEEELSDILDKKRTKDIMKGFQDRKVTEELCKRCSFKEKF